MKNEQSKSNEENAKEAFKKMILTIIALKELPTDNKGNFVADIAFPRSHDRPFLLFKN